ncbi:hypothetical protein LguiB_026735 [Lonicera macranthoides]
MLVFFEGINWAFDLAELLRAEAEMLGKGTSKVKLDDSTILVVKRLRELDITKPKFKQQMEVIGTSDVYSYGILLLELLTGKSSAYSTGGNENYHLVHWVNSVIREEWTARVFDLELLRYPNIEEEMAELLQIGMACVQTVAEPRPKMTDVVKIVEDIRRDLY